MCSLVIVELCLKSLCTLLPGDIGWKFLTSFYQTSSGLLFSQLFSHFASWTLVSVGLSDREGAGKMEEGHSEVAKICPEHLRHRVILALHLVYEVGVVCGWGGGCGLWMGY